MIAPGARFVALCRESAAVSLAFEAAVSSLADGLTAQDADDMWLAGVCFDRFCREVARAEAMPVDEPARRWLLDFVGDAALLRHRSGLD